MAFDFILNGKATRIDGLAPTTTLLDYLRTHGCTASSRILATQLCVSLPTCSGALSP